MNLVRVRVRATGQVIEMIPAVAQARLNGGSVELVDASDADRLAIPAPAETASVEPPARAVTKAHRPAKKKAKGARL